MPTGFIYVVNTVTPDYQQPDFSCVPTVWKDRLYFAACKVPMRPKMKADDWIFGVSPSTTKRRRIVFAAQIDEPITFAEAYRRYPALRAPKGPNPVQPVTHPGLPWPHSHYEPIKGSSHDDRWDRDLARPDLDRFFVCCRPDGFRNRWLGAEGPLLDPQILGFFNRCMVFGQSADGTKRNTGTPTAPIAIGHMYKGLHLETPEPEKLLQLCEARVPDTTSWHPTTAKGPEARGQACGETAAQASWRGCAGAAPPIRRASSRC